MWVARCDIYKTEENLSPKFKSIYECQNYIDKNLKVLEYLCTEFENMFEDNTDKKRNKLFFNLNITNHIRCYNIKQKRFADGFDF